MIKKRNLTDRHQHWHCCHHHRCDCYWDSLLSPHEQEVKPSRAEHAAQKDSRAVATIDPPIASW